ncbi:hypothetical protein SDC9_164249 [bioreactor metagenome]|uniref:Uncharacterized protein n=1 Tax=bioreactor metagenome TaxID=1076179 RepID=A0A645FTC5_9ZZZZ
MFGFGAVLPGGGRRGGNVAGLGEEMGRPPTQDQGQRVGEAEAELGVETMLFGTGIAARSVSDAGLGQRAEIAEQHIGVGRSAAEFARVFISLPIESEQQIVFATEQFEGAIGE